MKTMNPRCNRVVWTQYWTVSDTEVPPTGVGDCERCPGGIVTRSQTQTQKPSEEFKRATKAAGRPGMRLTLDPTMPT